MSALKPGGEFLGRWGALAGILPCLVALAGGCGMTSAKSLQTPEPPPPEVEVARPALKEVIDYFEFPGQTAAVGEVEIRARVTGYIVKVNFDDGQEVKAGDVLFEIDPRPYQAALDQARGELARQQATLVKAETDLARSERLRPSGAVSEDEYEQHVAQLAIVKAAIQTAEAAVRNAELNLEFTKVVSPIDGRVGRRLITEGNFVQPGLDESTVLTTVVTTRPIYVYFDVEEPVLLKYLGSLWQADGKSLLDRIEQLGVPVEIGLADETGFPHVGTLNFVDNKVDRGTGTIQARAVFEKPAACLSPGLYVRVRMPFGQARPAVLVPDRAIGTDLKEKYLLAVNAENVVERRLVQVGSLHDGLREILSGIGLEDRIIVEGLQRARGGIAVIPKSAESDKTVTAVAPSADQKQQTGGETAGENAAESH